MPPDSADRDPEPFIPPEARPAVVADLAKTAWQVAAALEAWETSRR
ncbi:MAG TPA: hypothetical protein VGL47_12550 [Amycolatopsis sp.]|uniref:Uncharacterized protein n=1 Tax=Amycolatopsis nalaikhensis TaxID=715472 RepID=A0ABY8XNI7_9PSEU|nr:hypothetical protein [Amycolatopsis sp. 2-2]WIV57199.1 hypothetical protein QP939_00390 [Amycolatopsis sp. 2-2]